MIKHLHKKSLKLFNSLSCQPSLHFHYPNIMHYMVLKIHFLRSYRATTSEINSRTNLGTKIKFHYCTSDDCVSMKLGAVYFFRLMFLF